MFRIIKEPKGYIVEIQVVKWTLFGLKYRWIPYVKSAGLDCAWHHSTIVHAVENLKKQVEHETKLNYR